MQKRVVIISASVILLVLIGFALARNQKGSAVERRENAVNTASINQLLDDALKAEANGEKLKAKDAYVKILNDYPEYDKIEEIQDKLGRVNVGIISSNAPTPQTVIHEVKVGDSLGKIAKQYGTTKELIKKSNNIKSDVIRVGQKLRIWHAPFHILVDKSQNTLTLKTGDELVKVYRASTGANNSTPVGTFTIDNKIVKPVWYKAGAKPIPAESPLNQLGTRWMGFKEDTSYGVHGTIEPDKIGQQVTSGCVRLENSQVEELFDIVPQGTQVQIQD